LNQDFKDEPGFTRLKNPAHPEPSCLILVPKTFPGCGGSTPAGSPAP